MARTAVALGRNTGIRQPGNHTTTFDYDANGNLEAYYLPGHSSPTSFTYNQLDELASRTLPGGENEAYQYDTYGNLLSKVDANGYTTTYSHDQRDRLLTQTPTTPNSTTVSFEYFPRGLRKTMNDETGVTSYGYDQLGRLTSKATPFGSLNYGYDNVGNVTSIASSNNDGVSASYGYDAANRLSSLTEGAISANYYYDGASRMTSSIVGQLTYDYNYDARHRVTDVDVKHTSSPIQNYHYDRNERGHIQKVTDINNRRVDYDYDVLDRLLSEKVSLDPYGLNGDIQYTYGNDLNRSIRTSSLPGISSEGYAYDANDRLTSHTYDDNGNTTALHTTGGDPAYDEYEFRDRLIQRNAGNIQYQYDGDGNRVAKFVWNEETEEFDATYYLIDDLNPTGYAQVLEELNDDFAVTATYAYGAGPEGEYVLIEPADEPVEAMLEQRADGSLWAGDTQLLSSVRSVAYGEHAGILAVDGSGNLVRLGGSSDLLTALQNLASAPVETIPGFTDVDSIHIGAEHCLVRLTSGEIQTWGANDFGQLGSGDFNASPTPLTINATSDSAVTGDYHSLMLDAGLVYAFGDNSYGQAGIEGVSEVTTPTAVTGLPADLVKLVASADSSYALTASGNVYAWGANHYGQLGDGSVGDHSTPTIITILENVVDIQAGRDFVIALTDNGEVFAWGRNDFGQTAQADVDFTTTPTKVQIAPADAIATGETAAYARTSTGDHLIWGGGATIAETLALDGSSLVHGAGKIVTPEPEWRLARYVKDGLGNVRMAVNDEAVLGEVDYDAFGNQIRQIGLKPRRLYQGEEYDPDLELYYLRARYYNPNAGRFHSADPFAGFASDPYSLHKYQYANNNPLSYHDPSGNFAVTNIATAYMALHLTDIYLQEIADLRRWAVLSENYDPYIYKAALGPYLNVAAPEYQNRHGGFADRPERTRDILLAGSELSLVGSFVGQSGLGQVNVGDDTRYLRSTMGGDIFFNVSPDPSYIQGRAEAVIETAMSMVYDLRWSINSGFDPTNKQRTTVGMRDTWGDVSYLHAAIKVMARGNRTPYQGIIYETRSSNGLVAQGKTVALMGMATRHLNASSGGGPLNLWSPKPGGFSLTAENIVNLEDPLNTLMDIVYGPDNSQLAKNKAKLETFVYTYASATAFAVANVDKLAILLVPIVPDAYELLTGKDIIFGEPLSKFDYGFAGAGLALDTIPLVGGLVDFARRGVSFTSNAMSVAKRSMPAIQQTQDLGQYYRRSQNAAQTATHSIKTSDKAKQATVPLADFMQFGGTRVAVNFVKSRAADSTAGLVDLARLSERADSMGEARRAQGINSLLPDARRLPGQGDDVASELIRMDACFVAGTLVLSEAGLTPIEDIKPGEKVWSKSEESGGEAFQTVLQTFETHPYMLVHLEYAVDGQPYEIVGTEIHPIWSITQDEWVDMGNLEPGELIRLSGSGEAITLSVDYEFAEEAPFTTYNFEVDQWHTYFVADSFADQEDAPGIWVHNQSQSAADCAEIIRMVTKRLDGVTDADDELKAIAAIQRLAKNKKWNDKLISQVNDVIQARPVVPNKPKSIANRNLTQEEWRAQNRADRNARDSRTWNTHRKHYWENLGEAELANPSGRFSPTNIARMLEGKAPKIKVRVKHRKTGQILTKDVSVEIHHRNIPQRSGSQTAHEPWNLEPSAPWAHEALDEYRHLGYDLEKIIKGPNSF
ncbi:polymorphic toxin-type HINT domain-containing protein [Cerasicoccus frondis]|uniref:polymorphic toxin-type HINT domain-containing protein n=1 Tax=Cerasicoccus frondis TaxID=490090 RepID=UPI0028526A50|nr:polymorphic toxin-type HINT domain-containing protein [Cerasicoccus frondis]